MGHVTYINRALERVLGYSPDLIYNRGDEGLMNLIHPDDLPTVQQHFENLSQARDSDIFAV